MATFTIVAWDADHTVDASAGPIEIPKGQAVDVDDGQSGGTYTPEPLGPTVRLTEPLDIRPPSLPPGALEDLNPGDRLVVEAPVKGTVAVGDLSPLADEAAARRLELVVLLRTHGG